MAKDKYRTKNGIVVMLDALGVRNMTTKECRDFIKKRDDLLSDFRTNLKDVRTAASQIKSVIGEPENVPKPKAVTFGDTIVLTWEHQKRPEISLAYLSLIWLSGAIVHGLLHGTLFRGAIAIGEYIQDRATVLGPAVSDAVEWYERAEWIGVIATPTAGERLSGFVNQMGGSDFVSYFPAWFVEYDVRLKSKDGKRSEESLWTVPWPFHFWLAQQHAKIPPEEVFSEVISRIERPPEAERKYENTTRFFNWYRENIMPNLPPPTNTQTAD